MVAMMTAALAVTAAPLRVEVGFAADTGAWTVLRFASRQCVRATEPDVALHVDGAPLPPFAEWKLSAIRRSGATTTVTRRAGEWEITTTTTCSATDIRRRARARWLGAGATFVRGSALRTPVLRVSRSLAEWAMVPGNFPIVRTPVASLAEGRRLAEVGWTRGDYGVGILHSPGSPASIIGAYRFVRDQARVSVIGRPGGACIEHAFDTMARLAHGEEVAIGEQILRVAVGDEASLRMRLAELSNRLDNGPPADQPSSLARAVLYEVHPWGRLESWPGGDRGNRYDRLTRLLPYYRKLGITTLWLLPVSWPPPWVYTLPEFDRIAPENGTAEQLKELVSEAHRQGIKVLIDLVVYGIHPDSPEVGRMPPDVWCMDPTGKPTRVWGGTVLAADTSHPAWQSRIAQVVDHWVRNFGFDGTRLDCIGWGQAHNYASKRPSDPIAYGGLQLNKVVRDAFRKVNPDAVTLPEGGKPLVFRNSDMLFDYPLYLAMRDMTIQPRLEVWVSAIRSWLEWERCAYPTRARRGLVRFLECHDTVSAAEYFGVGPSQALMAACIFMQGTPLLQQEQEIGFSEDVASWLRLRNRERCFYQGEASYTAVQCSDKRVLAFLRESPDGCAVVGINMTGEDIRCVLRWPADISARLPAAWDALAGKPIRTSGATASVNLRAYRPFVVLLKPRTWRSAARLAPVDDRTRWTVRTTEGDLTDIEQDYEARVRQGERPVDVLPVLARALRPQEGGLMDGAIPPGVGGGHVAVGVDAQFVTLANARVRLVLARRHGGAIAGLGCEIASAEPMIVGGGDLYTDFGLFANRLFASVDGETNPRLRFERDQDLVRVTFSGVFRQRAWNGVQGCAPAGPPLRYELSYAMDASERLGVRIELHSATPRGEPTFLAVRVPVGGFRGWTRGPLSGRAGGSPGVRLGAAGQASSPLIVDTESGRLEVGGGDLRNAFLIENGDGSAHLFMAWFDGQPAVLEPGRPLRAEAWLRCLPKDASP